MKRALAFVLLASCYRATLHLEPKATGGYSRSVNDAMHIQLLGVFEVAQPVNLVSACPGKKPVAIEEQLSPAGALVNLLVAISVMNPTVRCAQ